MKYEEVYDNFVNGTPYLTLNPNTVRRQFWADRRRGGSESILVLHSGENNPDLAGTDGGAEALAGYISRRSTYGSYHSVNDSDSIVKVCHYSWEAFGAGSPFGTNSWAIHHSLAWRAGSWRSLPKEYRDNVGLNAAIAGAAYCELAGIDRVWLSREEVIDIIAGRSQKTGMILHGELDPDRRSDPGWNKEDKEAYAESINQILGETMTPELEAMIRDIHAAIAPADFRREDGAPHNVAFPVLQTNGSMQANDVGIVARLERLEESVKSIKAGTMIDPEIVADAIRSLLK